MKKSDKQKHSVAQDTSYTTSSYLLGARRAAFEGGPFKGGTGALVFHVEDSEYASQKQVRLT